MPPSEAVSRWRLWRRRRERHASAEIDEENARSERQSSSRSSSTKRRRRRRRPSLFRRPPPQWVASAIRALLGVFLFAAVGLWSWDPLKALLTEKEIRKAVDSGDVKDATAALGTLRAREKVALAAKANLNAAVAVALLAAPASIGNTTAVAIQRVVGAVLGGLAAAAVAVLGHGAGRLLFPRASAATTNSRTLSLASPFSPAVIASAVVQALCAVALGTLAVYLGQRARIQYGAQLFGVTLLFVLAQAGAAPREAVELALSRGGGVAAGAALAAVLAVVVFPQSAARGAGEAVSESLLGVADLAEASLCCRREGEGEEEHEEGKKAPASAAASEAKRVLSSLSTLDECLAWAPGEVAVRLPRFGGRGGGDKGKRGRVLFYFPSLSAALLGRAPSGASPSSPSLPVPVQELSSLALSLRSAVNTLSTIAAVREREKDLPRSVLDAVASFSVRASPEKEPRAEGDGKEGENESEAKDTFDAIGPSAVAAWEALAEAWRSRERLRRRGGSVGSDDDLPRRSFSGESADAAVAALVDLATRASERARKRAASARAVALAETEAEEEEARRRRRKRGGGGGSGGYRGMFDRALSGSEPTSPTSHLAAQARSRFLAEVALASRAARDVVRARDELRLAVEAL